MMSHRPGYWFRLTFLILNPSLSARRLNSFMESPSAARMTVMVHFRRPAVTFLSSSGVAW